MLPPNQAAPSASQRAEPQTRLDLNRIRSAIPNIAPVFRNTPQFECPALGEALDCEIILKLETANPVRSFKARGTETVMARLADEPGARSAVCASAGNLGQALAWSGQSRGIAVTVVAGANASPLKLERIRALGATVRIVDGDIEDARLLARRMADIEGRVSGRGQRKPRHLRRRRDDWDRAHRGHGSGRRGGSGTRGRRHGDRRRLCLQAPRP